MRKFYLIATALLPLLLISNFSSAAITRTIAANLNWTDPKAWDNGVPGNNTDVEVRHSINMTTGQTVSGNLIVTSTGNLIISAELKVKLNLTINGAITAASSAGYINMYAGSSSINGIGSICRISAFASNTVLTGTNLTVNGNFTLPAGAVVYNNGTVIVRGAIVGGDALSTWHNYAGSSVSATGAILSTGALSATAVPNTVIYNGSANAPVKSTTYYNLTIDKGTATATHPGVITVANILDIKSGVLSLAGSDFTSNGTALITGRVNISSTLGLRTFNHVQINSGGTWSASVAASSTINGNFTNNGTFTSGAGTYTLAGTAMTISGSSVSSFDNITCSGSYTNNGSTIVTTSLAGGGAFTNGAQGVLNLHMSSLSVTTLNASAAGNTVSYSGSGDQSIRIPSDVNYHNLAIAGGGTKSLTGATTVNGALTISSTLDVSTLNHSLSLFGDLTNNGSFIPRAGTVFFKGNTSFFGSAAASFNAVNISGTLNCPVAQTFTVTGAFTNSGTFNSNAGTVVFAGNTSHTGTGATTFCNITISGTFVANSAVPTSVVGNFINNGIFTANGSTYNFSGNTSLSGTTTTTFSSVRITGTAAAPPGDLVITSNFTNDGVFNSNNGTIVFNGVTSHTGSSATSFNNLTILGSFTANGLVQTNVSGNFSNFNIFTPNGSTFNFNGSSEIGGTSTSTFNSVIVTGTVTAPPSLLIVTGSFTNNGTFNGNGGTVEFIGSTAHTGTGSTVFHHLNISGTYIANSTGTTEVRGDWYNTGSFGQNGSTIRFSGSAQSITRAAGAEVFHNLTIASGSRTILNSGIVINNSLNIDGELDVSVLNFPLDVKGTWSNNGTFNPRNGTVTFSGTSPQVLQGNNTFFSFVISNPVSVALSGSLSVLKDVTISSGALNAGSGSITIAGNWNNNSTFIPGKSTVTFNGSTSQSILGVNEFHNLVINSAGVSLQATQSVRSELRLTKGTLTIGTYDLILLSDAAGTARIAPVTGGAVSGSVTAQRYIPGKQTSWRFLASPVGGTTIFDWKDDFVMSGFAGSQNPNMSFKSVYFYNETVAGTKELGYTPASSTSQAVPPGVGIWAYIGPVPLTMEVKGPPTIGTINIPVSYTPSAGPLEDGWCMVGNPYASTINWDSPAWVKENLNNAIYIWGPELQQYAAYVNGAGINGGSPFVPSQQSFWVQANSVSPKLVASESVKDAAQGLYRNNEDLGKISFKLLNPTQKSDETVLRFSESSSEEFDGEFDAFKMFSMNSSYPGVSLIGADGNEYSINTVPEPSKAASFFINVRSMVKGDFKLLVNASELPGIRCLGITDLITGKEYKISGMAEIAFSVSDTGTITRFALTISAPVSIAAIDPLCNGKSGRIEVKSIDTFSVIVKSSVGVNVNSASGVTSFSSDVPAGTYTVEVQGSCGFAGVDTISVVEPEPLISSIHIVSPVCEGNGTAELGISGGVKPYQILWNNVFTTAAISAPAGKYGVVATDAHGCSITDSAFIFTKYPVFASFSSQDTLVIHPGGLTAEFRPLNTSSGAESYIWNFNDGSQIVTASDPIHFLTEGSYNVLLTAANDSCSSSYSRRVVVVKEDVITSASTLQADGIEIIHRKGNVVLLNRSKEMKPFRVYSSLGQLLFSDSIAPESQAEIPGKFSTGFYYIFVSNKTYRVPVN